MTQVARGVGPGGVSRSGVALPIRIHDLLLTLAGRLDDDALADARQMLASAELDRSLEFVAGCIAAGNVILTREQRRELEALFSDTYLDPSLIDRVKIADRSNAGRHRFAVGAVEGREPDRGVADAVSQVLDVLPDVRSMWCVWRLTPSGPASGPVPHRLVLVGVGPGGFPPATAYRVEHALRRAGIRASVEVLVDGVEPTEYHREAMRNARQVPFVEHGSSRPRIEPSVEAPQVRAAVFEEAPRAEPMRTALPRVEAREPFEPPRQESFESPVRQESFEPPRLLEPPRLETPLREPEPPRVEAPRAEPLRAEPLHAEPLRAEPLRAEPLRAEPLQAESLHSEPLREPLRSVTPPVTPPVPMPPEPEPFVEPPAAVQPPKPEPAPQFEQERLPETKPVEQPPSALNIETRTDSAPSPPRRARAEKPSDEQKQDPPSRPNLAPANGSDTHSAAFVDDILNTQERNLLRELQDELARREQQESQSGTSGSWQVDRGSRHGKNGGPFDHPNQTTGPMIINGVPPHRPDNGFTR